MTQNVPAGYRFDLFEVDLDKGTLLRKGHRVRLQKLPFQMLVALLENPGQPVSREELRKRLWSDRTFIEFDNSLQVAVAKLREALGEQAAEPRFIKTISREGYQFIGKATPVLSPSGATDVAASLLEPERVVASPTSMVRTSRRLPVFAVAASCAAVAVIAIAIVFFFRYSNRALITANDKIALGGVINETGDPAFDGTLSTAFRFKLQESPYLSPVQDQSFQRLVKADEASATLASYLTACRSLIAAVFLDGRISGHGPPYQVAVTAWRCRDGHRLATTSSSANSQADVMAALDQATSGMRLRLGESESSLGKYSSPLAQATTSSLLALKSFTLGEDKRRRGQVAQSISDYKLAIDLDPQFALAYARAGMAYMNLREYRAAKTYNQRAFELRERATDRERLYIAAHYYSTVTGELSREMEAYKLWQAAYPHDVLPLENLTNAYLSLGQPDKALELSKSAIQLDPISSIPYAFEARAYLGSGKYAELNALCGNADRWRSDMVLFHSACYLSAFAQNNDAAMRRELQWAHGNPQESVMLEYAAWVAMYEGSLAEARRGFAEARQNAASNNLLDFVAELDLDEAGIDADLGLANEARQHALDALRIAPGARSVQATAALALARSGDIARARIEAGNATAQAPLSLIQSATLTASTQAAIELYQHDPKAAIKSMDQVHPFDDVGYMALSPTYYRGTAFLEDRQFDIAAQAFQAGVDHRILYPASIYSALCRLQRGRALQLSGHADDARLEFQALEQIWKVADPDFPPLKQLHLLEKSR